MDERSFFLFWWTSKSMCLIASRRSITENACFSAFKQFLLAFVVQSIYPQWWEVPPRAYRLLFSPWRSWGLAALKGLASFSFLPPSSLTSLNLKPKPMGHERSPQPQHPRVPLLSGLFIYKCTQSYTFQIQVVTDKCFRAWILSSFQVIFNSLNGLKYHIQTHFSNAYSNPTAAVRVAGPCQHSLLTKLTT